MRLIERVDLNGKSLQEKGLRRVNCYFSTEGGGRFPSGESDLLKKKKKKEIEREWNGKRKLGLSVRSSRLEHTA